MQDFSCCVICSKLLVMFMKAWQLVEEDTTRLVNALTYSGGGWVMLDCVIGKVARLLPPGTLMLSTKNSSMIPPITFLMSLKFNFSDTFLSMFRLCSCGTKPQRSENHHFVMTSSWEPQCHHDIIMRTPRITGKPKFSWSGGL